MIKAHYLIINFKKYIKIPINIISEDYFGFNVSIMIVLSYRNLVKQIYKLK